MRRVKSPASEQKQSQAIIHILGAGHAKRRLAEKTLGPWQTTRDNLVDHKPAACPYHKEGLRDPGLHQECCQKVEGGDPSPLVCIMRPHCYYSIQVWAAQSKRVTDILDFHQCTEGRAQSSQSQALFSGAQ